MVEESRSCRFGNAETSWDATKVSPFGQTNSSGRCSVNSSVTSAREHTICSCLNVRIDGSTSGRYRAYVKRSSCVVSAICGVLSEHLEITKR